MEIAGLGAPSGQIWTARWTPGSAAPQWTPRGRPAEARILAGIGVTPDPASGTLIMVVGNDQQVWVAATASATPAWTRWDPPTNSQSTSVTSGRSAVLLDTGPGYAIVLNQIKRPALVEPPS